MGELVVIGHNLQLVYTTFRVQIVLCTSFTKKIKIKNKMIKKGKTKSVTKLSFDAEDAGWSSGDEGRTKIILWSLFTSSRIYFLFFSSNIFYKEKAKESFNLRKVNKAAK